MALTFKDVDQILRIIEEFPASEVIFEYGDLKLHVRRSGAAPGAFAPARPAQPAQPVERAPLEPAPSGGAAASAPRRVEAEQREGLAPVISPMMGVFYAAPAPDAEPFVKEGQQVAEGDEVGIIEVMKIMNMIKAPCAGTVVEVVAQNAQTVASGSALMWIRPEGAKGKA